MSVVSAPQPLPGEPPGCYVAGGHFYAIGEAIDVSSK
ncbi:hypothetical protein N183_11315 [Sinorhizobium sp. Sb3]|nr:hypothetical protein N183_11315 [Sinorhizobium sp. Sb3]